MNATRCDWNHASLMAERVSGKIAALRKMGFRKMRLGLVHASGAGIEFVPHPGDPVRAAGPRENGCARGAGAVLPCCFILIPFKSGRVI
jgi:hypothetical protein